MKPIACYVATIGLSLFSFLGCQNKGSLDNTEDPWLRVLTTEHPSLRPTFVLLEYPNSFRLDSLSVHGDTLLSVAYPDSVGVFTLISAAGQKLWSFRMDPEKSVELLRDSMGTRLKGGDSINFLLADYYRKEQPLKKRYLEVADSIVRKKMPTDSILPIWKRKYARQDSIWQSEVISFARTYPKEMVAIVPASSYLYITQNNMIRRPVYNLLDLSLRENAMINAFKSGY